MPIRFNEEHAEFVAAVRRGNRLARKPCNFSDVDGCFFDVSPELREVLGDPIDLPSDFGTFESLPEGYRETICLVRINGTEYIVNTEGYEYCRYVARVAC